MKLKNGQYRFWDSNHIPWIWDGNEYRLYVEGTLEEDPESGYAHVFSLNQAMDILEQDGYMEIEE